MASENGSPDRRIRTLTSKAMELYEEKEAKLKLQVTQSWDRVDQVLKEHVKCYTIEEFKNYQRTLCMRYGAYRMSVSRYSDYLNSINTADSLKCLNVLQHADGHHDDLVNLVLIETDSKIDNLGDTRSFSVKSDKSHKSDKSAMSERSNAARSKASSGRSKSSTSSLATQAKVKAQAALARKSLIDKEISLLKKKVEIDGEIKALREEEIVKAAEAELKVYEEETVLDESSLQSDVSSDPQETTKHERTRQYVESINSTRQTVPKTVETHINSEQTVPKTVETHKNKQTVPENVQPTNVPKPTDGCAQFRNTDKELASELSRFMLRKELLLSSLTKFDDKPENYPVWKVSFKSVTQELDISAREELDLLVKWLGPESGKHAKSVRASSSANPCTGVAKLWERLDERFGAPEMVESSLRKKLESFSRITVKDSKRLFELADILDEIENNMSDPKYSDLLSVYNTSVGVIPIVNKLPYGIQQKWTNRASKYKSDYQVSFPPFSCFTKFVRDMSKVQNDPGFMYDTKQSSHQQSKVRSLKTTFCDKQENSSFRKTEAPHHFQKPPSNSDTCTVEQEALCPYHNVYGHTLSYCRSFMGKPLSVRKKFVKDKGICFKCCEGSDHQASNCPQELLCRLCKGRHATAMHLNIQSTSNKYGGEKESSSNRASKKPGDVSTACTQLCKSSPGGKSCARVVGVNVYSKDNPERKVKMYALLDDQSNKTLAKPEFFEAFGGQFDEVEFSISSCTGKINTSGRKAFGFVVENLDGSRSHELPSVTECAEIPDLRDEIPTADVAKAYPHLNDLADSIPELDNQAQVLLLIGRDLTEAHHVLQQRIGQRGHPFAQELTLGWVIIGESCLGKVHAPNSVCVNKTYVQSDGRGSIMPPCESKFFIKDQLPGLLREDVFVRTKDDDKLGLSAEDEEFLCIMKEGFTKSEDGHWSAPLPLRSPRPRLPNNKSQALRRTYTLQSSLEKNPEKQRHFVEFMARIFKDGYAEPAPPLRAAEECWYLPIFGVYHAKKGQIRVVFDSSAHYQGLSLNSVLLQGPDLMNSLLGVLMRFRKQRVAVMADIQQMFFQFRVHKEHRNLLRFLWFKGNDPNSELIEYRMCSHVFGNSPSPSIASYGLRKTAAEMESEFGHDVRNFVEKDFYVDDGLTSFPDANTAVDVLSRTQKALLKGGNLRLHKIVSNDPDVMKAFSKEDLAKELQDLCIGSESLPPQRSLGMNWNLNTDCFTYSVSKEEKAFTRRGVLSTVNSLYDPLGFVAPVVNQGRLLMRDMMKETTDWDQPLPDNQIKEWATWKESLIELEQLSIPRTYLPVSFDKAPEVHVFSDASERAISAVAYMRAEDDDGVYQVGFVLGKSKVAPKAGHTVPRLELCAAVIAVELAETISEELSLPIEQMKFYTDSRVVLGYLHNKERRFYIYVQNRVARILKSTNRQQWQYISTDENPADQGTRPILTGSMKGSKWLNGPDCLRRGQTQPDIEVHELQSPENDKEIRPVVQCMKVSIPEKRLEMDRFEDIKSWNLLVRVVALLKTKAQTLRAKKNCSTSHLNRPDMLTEAERIILREVQHEVFSEELVCLSSKQSLPKNSSIQQLNPYVDKQGLLCVGGRLENASELSAGEKHPIILPKGHFVSRLIALHFHSNVRHQGCHFTEGAIRSAGFWIVGVKRLVRGIIQDCVKCKKLRSKVGSQIMSDLPEDRISPGAPFSSVGVDVFGPWNVTARRTRGGMAQSKRWAVIYTCLTTRAIHLEVIEELSTSSFINATRRFIAIRGPVRLFRSDRGTNFVGATECMKVDAINVEDKNMQNFMDINRTTWIFNSPHSSHMGGVWERLIGVVRRILESMLRDARGDLTHEVLTTFMAEASLIVNSRPLVSVSTDPENPNVLSPMTLLTQKPVEVGHYLGEISVKDMYKAQWRRVQCLSDIFWKRWRTEFLQTLQQRKKWPIAQREMRTGDVVLMVEDGTPRNSWPMGVIQELFPSKDGHVRKVLVKVSRAGDDEPRSYVRLITKLVTLLESEDKCE